MSALQQGIPLVDRTEQEMCITLPRQVPPDYHCRFCRLVETSPCGLPEVGPTCYCLFVCSTIDCSTGAHFFPHWPHTERALVLNVFPLFRQWPFLSCLDTARPAPHKLTSASTCPMLCCKGSPLCTLTRVSLQSEPLVHRAADLQTVHPWSLPSLNAR